MSQSVLPMFFTRSFIISGLTFRSLNGSVIHFDFIFVQNLPAVQETQLCSLDWEGPLEKGMETTPVFLPGEFHGQRRLLGYSPWGSQRIGNN